MTKDKFVCCKCKAEPEELWSFVFLKNKGKKDDGKYCAECFEKEQDEE